MFGIGGGELIVIIFIALMLFGAEKIPDIARTLGKGMAQLKNATNEIKSEITKSADANDLNLKSLTSNFDKEVNDIKSGFTNVIPNNPLENNETVANLTSEIEAVKENLEDLSGPIKRQK